MFSSSPDHFRPHDSLNLPTFIHISLMENTETNDSINFPFSFRLEDPTLERIAVKKLKCIERGYAYPHIDIVFARGETSLTRHGHHTTEKDEKNCGFYKSVQTISRNSTELQLIPDFETETSLNGYVIFAYKTMEHMHTQKFTSSWKTWSGARMLSTRMPLPHIVTKMSFFKKVSGQLNFEYILIAKIKNMMVNAAPALNVLHYMKPKVCAYVGAYRKISFEVNKNLCRSLGLLDANYVDALTNRFRVTYSNNTGYVELSNFIEYRCKEEEEEAREARERHIKKSTHVQTEPTESSKHARRTLPRTLPSTPSSMCSPSTPLQFYPSYPSPNSVIGSILKHKSQIVTVGNNYLLVLDNRDSEASNRGETVINDQITSLPSMIEHKTPVNQVSHYNIE
ncbi:hypothetical protein GCK72_024153 [Caenorhabditis remanei]|uniref:DUF7153 domain-containing protein n=1 Tax=Caenorhabditis remanei TaxID=31234 RepID=A0A6A5FYN8_CAERE|nr:hypothetical protein GCK72_024153 [Caenorhabditis remanei]KAF1747687.1 hypothetical protein GCK72_024153 [Caenorhabditis remanei]